MTDTTMEAITKAVTAGQTGDTAGAKRQLLELWDSIGAAGDPFHRCTLAHYLADLCSDAAEALTWDVRALDAADALTDERVKKHDAGVQLAGFYPSLHLNLAENYRRLASFPAAEEQIKAAQEKVSVLADDGYGALIRGAIGEVAEAIARRDTTPRPSAPGPAS